MYVYRVNYCLSWLKVPHEKCKVFVSNRIHKMTMLLPDYHWDYIPSANNPADSASWDIFPTELVNHKLYLHGPDILYREVLDGLVIGPETNWKLHRTGMVRAFFFIISYASCCRVYLTFYSHMYKSGTQIVIFNSCWFGQCLFGRC